MRPAIVHLKAASTREEAMKVEPDHCCLLSNFQIPPQVLHFCLEVVVLGFAGLPLCFHLPQLLPKLRTVLVHGRALLYE